MGACLARPAGDARRARRPDARRATTMVAPARGKAVASPSSPSPRLPLSPLDSALCVRGLVVYWAFMYDRAVDAETLRASLASTLAEYPVLAGRVRVASRSCLRLNLEVSLDDAGVAFSTADSPATLADLARPGAVQGRSNLVPHDIFTPLYPWQCVHGGGVLVAVRVTRLADGAAAVAVSWSHAVADGRAMHAFLDAWAARARRISKANTKANANANSNANANADANADERAESSTPPKLAAPASAAEVVPFDIPSPPSHDRLAALEDAPVLSAPPDAFGARAFPALRLDADPRLRSTCFVASRLCGLGARVACQRLTQQTVRLAARDLAAMKASVERELRTPSRDSDSTSTAGGMNSAASTRASSPSRGSASSTPPPFVSTNDVIVAFVWATLRRLGEGRRDYARDGFALQTVDRRARGARGLEPELFGNASTLIRADLPREDRGEGVSGAPGGSSSSSSLLRLASRMAAAVRASVLAARASDAEAAEGGGEEGGGARREISALARASTAAQLRAVVVAVTAADAFNSSWQFPLWGLDLDGGGSGPSAFWGSVYPQAPWTSCVVPDAPPPRGEEGGAGVCVHVTVPRDLAERVHVEARWVVSEMSGH